MTEEQIEQARIEALHRKFEEIAASSLADGRTYKQLLYAAARGILVQTLRCCDGNQCKAASKLKIHRNTIARMSSVLGVDASDMKPRRRGINGRH